MDNVTQLQNLFTTKQPLFILSSTRSKKEFYLHFKSKSHLDFNLHLAKDNDEILKNCFMLFDTRTHHAFETNKDIMILPDALSIDEFFTKITFSDYSMIPNNVRDFFMFQALQNVKQRTKNTQKKTQGFLNFETSFMLFLQTSSVLLQFYDELREHKIAITKESLEEFVKIDSYEEYNEQLSLLAEIYEEYNSLLKANELTDSIYSDTTQNYKIFSEYIQSFSSIHIELEGFISPLQYEILERVSSITPTFLYFRTDSYNIGHFQFLKQELESFKSYIYNLQTKDLFTQDTKRLQKKNIKLYKTTKRLSQANLALALAHKWQEKILCNEANENDFAIILPSESFCNHLLTLDSNHIFNFAMGIHIAYLESYSLLLSLYDSYMQTKVFDIAPLLECKESYDTEKMNELKKQCLQDSTILLNPNILHLEKILMLLFENEGVLLAQMMQILSTFNHIANRNFFNVNTLHFENLFTLFMREIVGLKINHVAGGKIKVIGTLEARNLHFKEVLILDFSDDFVPNVTHDDMFLNSKIRSHYGMPTRKDKENLYKHHYYNIMKNTEITHISFVNNEEQIESNMLFEIGCNTESAQSIDTLYSYYDMTKQANIIFYEDEYKPFGIVENLSATALNVYNECERKFYYRYVEGLKEERTQSQYFGSIIHEWLFESYKPYIEETLTLDSINAIESSFFSKFYALKTLLTQNNQEESTEIDIKTLDMKTFAKLDSFTPYMKAFFEYERERVKKHSIKILGLEYTFRIENFRINATQDMGYTLNGVIDRIDMVDNGIVLYDYKSGTSIPKSSDLQMPFYAMCAADMPLLQPHNGLHIKLAYYHLGAKDINKILLFNDENKLNENIQKIYNILETFGETNEMTEKLSTCKDCQYALLCNRA